MDHELYNDHYFDTIAAGWNRMSYGTLCDELRADRRLDRPGCAVVDLGCGTGLYSTVLQKENTTYLGIDISEQALKVARSRGVNVVLGEAESIPLPDASVDYLFSTEVIEHVQSPERMMQEVSRVLKPDGAAFITTTTYQFIIFHYIWLLPNLKRGYGDLADYLLGYFSKGKRDGFVRLLYDFTGGHLWGFLKKDLVRLAGRGDLEVEDVYYLNVQPLLPFTLQGGGVRRMLRKVVETVNGAFLHKRRAVYGPNIVLKLRKPATC